jgi:hypothetical protein
MEHPLFGWGPGRTRTLQTSQRLSSPPPPSVRNAALPTHQADSVAVRVGSRADAFDSVATVGWTVHVHSTSEFLIFRRSDAAESKTFHERTAGIQLIQHSHSGRKSRKLRHIRSARQPHDSQNSNVEPAIDYKLADGRFVIVVSLRLVCPSRTLPSHRRR